MEFLKTFDIITLTETWDIDTVDTDLHFNDYVSYTLNAKRSQCRGRHMGGVLVLVKRHLCEYVTRFCPDFEFGVVLNIDKKVFALDKDCLYCSVYLPPEGSPFYYDIANPVFDILDSLFASNVFMSRHIVLNGDLNSRTGTEQDFTSLQDNIPELEEFVEILAGDIEIPRYSSDKKVNKFGRYLLNLCKT